MIAVVKQWLIGGLIGLVLGLGIIGAGHMIATALIWLLN